METIDYNRVIERKKTIRATHLQGLAVRSTCVAFNCGESPTAAPRRHCQHSYSATKGQPAGTVRFILNLTISSPQQ